MPRGRNKALIARRDEMLCHRYHYWTETQRLRFDDTLKILSEEEFFLSEERILTICLLYTSPSPRDAHEPRMPSSA